MRLTTKEQQAIKDVIESHDSNAKIYLFGSRADDKKKGGDIDLLVFSKSITPKERRLIRLELFEQLGEQKIDLIIASDEKQPFVRIALAEGVLL